VKGKTTRRAHPVLALSCVCALMALVLMSWSLFDPHVFPIIVAMSLGQVLGTASFVAYLYVVFHDFHAQMRAQRDARKPDAT